MANALARESSPYLLQHAENPVDWQPWSQQALDLARKLNRPILLSIGYSACHWCHVMAHESFENTETAELMNTHFINIKVDREERPDLDRIYQSAHQLITQRPGGWPLTMFLSPEHQLPFFGGTYFPDTARYGMISFRDLLERIASVYRDEPDKIQQQTESMQQAINDLAVQAHSNQVQADVEALQIFDQQLLHNYDDQFGGFGSAPKFPQPAMLELAILRAFSRTATDPLYKAIDFSLEKIAMGGIQDHLAGGFYRYSVDEKWMIPHFEKMLYDNGQLLYLFALMFRLTKKSIYQTAVEGIYAWLGNEMLSETGSFFAALDADSEGVEGKFYVWTPEQVEVLLDSRVYPPFAYKYGLDGPANFEQQWHLHAYHENRAVAEAFNINPDDIDSLLIEAHQQLLEQRNQRIRPGLDNKILTAWNALAIQGLAFSARIFLRPEYYETARQCLLTLRNECWYNNRLLAISQVSGKLLPAYLDDYAHLLKAIIDCLQYRWHSEDLDFAIILADQLLELFEDTEHGGFYFTASDHENLIERPKSWQDEAMPCGNATASLAIYRLGMLLGNQRYVHAAEKALQSVANNLNQNPLHAVGFLKLLEVIDKLPCTIVVRGEAAELEQWQEILNFELKPGQQAFFIPVDAKALPDAIKQKKPGNKTMAWVCHGFTCQPPVNNLDELLGSLK
ncbi:MAG: thioredoxin domain-containing protein [Gammaproteobacteria bacterium]